MISICITVQWTRVTFKTFEIHVSIFKYTLYGKRINLILILLHSMTRLYLLFLIQKKLGFYSSNMIDTFFQSNNDARIIYMY